VSSPPSGRQHEQQGVAGLGADTALPHREHFRAVLDHLFFFPQPGQVNLVDICRLRVRLHYTARWLS